MSSFSFGTSILFAALAIGDPAAHAKEFNVEAETMSVIECAMARVPVVDDGISDAKTVALGLSYACNKDYWTLVESLASQMENDRQRTMVRTRLGSQQERSGYFVEFVLTHRAKLRKQQPQ